MISNFSITDFMHPCHADVPCTPADRELMDALHADFMGQISAVAANAERAQAEAWRITRAAIAKAMTFPGNSTLH